MRFEMRLLHGLSSFSSGSNHVPFLVLAGAASAAAASGEGVEEKARAYTCCCVACRCCCCCCNERRLLLVRPRDATATLLLLLLVLLLLLLMPHTPLLATVRTERAVLVAAAVLRPRSVRRVAEEGSMMIVVGGEVCLAVCVAGPRRGWGLGCLSVRVCMCVCVR